MRFNDFPHDILLGKDPLGALTIGFDFEDFFIMDPTVSTCSRFAVEPKDYGLTQEQVNRFAEIRDRLHAEIDSAVGLAIANFNKDFGSLTVDASFMADRNTEVDRLLGNMGVASELSRLAGLHLGMRRS